MLESMIPPQHPLTLTPFTLPGIGTVELDLVVKDNTYFVSNDHSRFLVYLSNQGENFVSPSYIELWVYAVVCLLEGSPLEKLKTELNSVVDTSSRILLCYVDERGEYTIRRCPREQFKNMWLPGVPWI